MAHTSDSIFGAEFGPWAPADRVNWHASSCGRIWLRQSGYVPGDLIEIRLAVNGERLHCEHEFLRTIPPEQAEGFKSLLSQPAPAVAFR